jgi:acyl-CoA synthetase (AMP-forming)/AMP-acid ligase II
MAGVGNLGCVFTREPDKTAIIDLRTPEAPRVVSYADFDAECDAVARGLLRRGLKRGDKVGILSLNRTEFLAAFFGTMRAGMVTVPISIRLPRETIAYIIKDSGAALLFCDHERREFRPAEIAAIDFDDGSYTAFLDRGTFASVDPAPGEIGMMLYTSGSTGRPKGVPLSHATQLWGLEVVEPVNGDMSRQTVIVAAPMFHMNATFNTKVALKGHATLVLMPTFNARGYAEAIARHKVTWLTSVPTMMAMVVRERELVAKLDLSSVVRVGMGSAPLSQALHDKVQALFPNAVLGNSYGTTEAGPVVFGPHPAGKPRPATSVGYPVPGGEMELREGPSPDEGVLYMRNPSTMTGYHNLPEQTAKALKDGWYRSGDIMRRDADGFFYFLGRADDMFVCGGENIWPGEVDKMLERMPAVQQAFVVAVPDEIKGQIPFAFVVPRPGGALTEDAVKQFALANGPAYAHPRYVEFVAELPLAATNKIDRRALTLRAEEIARSKPRPGL